MKRVAESVHIVKTKELVHEIRSSCLATIDALEHDDTPISEIIYLLTYCLAFAGCSDAIKNGLNDAACDRLVILDQAQLAWLEDAIPEGRA
jgi:hypothetical protein